MIWRVTYQERCEGCGQEDSPLGGGSTEEAGEERAEDHQGAGQGNQGQGQHGTACSQGEGTLVPQVEADWTGGGWPAGLCTLQHGGEEDLGD